jgi:methylenetetrahydrofolate dehydrogenase (NADP+)/methenyltetrahydrofolate cyclohydrolase
MIINCKEIAQKWKNECVGINAHLAIIQVGDNPASNSYIKGKLKDCDEVGFKSSHYKLDAEVTEEELTELILKLNNDKDVNGIIVQLPLPKHIDAIKIVNLVAVEKDVDGFLYESEFTPCTPMGVVNLLDEINVDVNGKFVVVLGRSEFVGKKAADLLLAKNATVAICHSKTPIDVRDSLLKSADIVISAVGSAKLFEAIHVKDGAIVIDVGINRNDFGKLCGDFVPDENRDILYTSVPGGVGLLTRAMLLKNTYAAYMNQNKNIM